MIQITSRRPVVDCEAPYSSFCLKMLPAVPMTQEQFFNLCRQNRELRSNEQPRGNWSLCRQQVEVREHGMQPSWANSTFGTTDTVPA